MKKLRHCHRMY